MSTLSSATAAAGVSLLHDISDRRGPVRIRLDGVSKRFASVVAMDRVSFEVAPGTLTAILGPSGCGKSTLLRTIAGFEDIDGGRILLNGRDIASLPLRDRNVGFVFQHYALFPHMTVAENVAFALTVRHRPARERAARVDELLELVQLPGYARRLPHELSGGQRQRVAFARALAGDPSLLLLDEPFAALDLQVRRELREWLRRLHEVVPVTTLLVTHDADEAMEIADGLVLMRAGRIEQTGTPLDVYDEPISPFALQLLGPANEISAGDGVAFVRPHDLRVEAAPFEGAHPARVSRLAELGSRTRLELALGDGTTLHADLPARTAAGLLVKLNALLYVAPLHQRSFPAAKLERTS